MFLHNEIDNTSDLLSIKTYFEKNFVHILLHQDEEIAKVNES